MTPTAQNPFPARLSLSALAQKNGTGAAQRSPSTYGRPEPSNSMISLSGVELLRILILVRVLPILVLSEEFRQRARFTLLLQ